METSFQITIVYDNLCAMPYFQKGFGFAALIKAVKNEGYILFDTGGKGSVLISNIGVLKIDINKIRKVLISHNHSDHSGGLSAIYNINPKINIYVPIDNKIAYEKHYTNTRVIGVEQLEKIENNVYSSGQMRIRSLVEHCLYLLTNDKRVIILVGCAHPGLEHFIVKARELGRLEAVIGGFHDFNKLEYLEDFNVIGACHCTSRINEIRKRFPIQYKSICVGSQFSF
jgi:7,8-dihydropterin-6-yl-methyl-4-(beta-D-ribofuranosyl)aminobenzene 5'-phosphate synthase